MTAGTVRQDEELQQLLSRLAKDVGRYSTNELIENLRQRENVAARIHDVRSEMRDLAGEPLPWRDEIIYDATGADQ